MAYELESERLDQEHSDWENSLEGVHYNLVMFVDSTELEGCITRTVQRLPQDVREYVYDECTFASVGSGIHGQVVPPSARWLILLDAGIVVQYGEDEAMGIIAHEIAHAYLKHNQMDPNTTPQVELDASSQTKAWGFVGMGASEEHARSRYQSLQ